MFYGIVSDSVSGMLRPQVNVIQESLYCANRLYIRSTNLRNAAAFIFRSPMKVNFIISAFISGSFIFCQISPSFGKQSTKSLQKKLDQLDQTELITLLILVILDRPTNEALLGAPNCCCFCRSVSGGRCRGLATQDICWSVIRCSSFSISRNGNS